MMGMSDVGRTSNIVRSSSARDKKPGAGRTTLADVRDVLIECGYSPAEAMVRIARKAEEEFADERYEPAVRRAFLDLSYKANAELQQYIQPKLTRTEQTGPDGGPLVIEVVKFGADKTPG